MNNDEIISTLEKFKEFLHVGNIFSDPFRWLGWVFVQGLAFILDGLEKVTDDVLLIKKFFQNPEVVAFVDTIRPFLYILLAFSLLYTGYLLIFQKKFDREGIAINLFIALIVIALLGTGMNKTNEFTDDAIKAIGKSQLYGEEEGTLSENILSRNIHDLVEFDANGWSSTEIDRPNTIPLDMIRGIAITEKFDSSRSELNMSSAGKDMSKKQLIWVSTGKDLAKFDQSGVEWNNSYYYRYSLNWVTLLATIIIMAFTLFSIAYKLARLSFELAFNYILAIIIAPADVHDGQKTKKILQSILNTFLVIILIFLSMKVYMIGTAYLVDELSGLAYLIALIAFSVAVVDGPNIVERLFGIDAGLKNGWGVLAGAYAGGKMVAGLGKGIANMNKDGSDSKNKSMSAMSGGNQGEKAPSPNDGDDPSKPPNGGAGGSGDDKCPKCKQKPCVCGDSGTAGETSGSDEGQEGNGTGGQTSSVSQQAEDKATTQRKQAKAPSPNDVESIATGAGASNAQTTSSSQSADAASVTDNATVRTDANITGVQGNSTGSQTRTGSGGVPQTPTATQPSGASNAQTTSSSQSTETASVTDNATVRTDANVTSVQDNVQGNSTGSQTRTGSGGVPQTPTATQPSGASNAQTTSSSQSTETARATNNATVKTDTEVSNVVQEVSGNTSTSTTRTGGGTSQAPTERVNTSGANNTRTTDGSHTTEKSKVVSNSTVTTDTEISNTVQDVTGSTSTRTNETGNRNHNPQVNQSNERKRPRSYSVDKGNTNMVDKMKNYRKK